MGKPLALPHRSFEALVCTFHFFFSCVQLFIKAPSWDHVTQVIFLQVSFLRACYKQHINSEASSSSKESYVGMYPYQLSSNLDTV